MGWGAWHQQRSIFFVHASLSSNHPCFERQISKIYPGKAKKALSSHAYLYTPKPPDTHPPWRYACGSSGSHAGLPTLGTSRPNRQYPPPPSSRPRPALQVLTDNCAVGRIRTGCSRPPGVCVGFPIGCRRSAVVGCRALPNPPLINAAKPDQKQCRRAHLRTGHTPDLSFNLCTATPGLDPLAHARAHALARALNPRTGTCFAHGNPTIPSTSEGRHSRQTTGRGKTGTGARNAVSNESWGKGEGGLGIVVMGCCRQNPPSGAFGACQTAAWSSLMAFGNAFRPEPREGVGQGEGGGRVTGPRSPRPREGTTCFSLRTHGSIAGGGRYGCGGAGETQARLRTSDGSCIPVTIL